MILNKTIMGEEIEILEKAKYLDAPWYSYKVKFKKNGEVRIAGAKYIEDKFWK